LLLFFISAAFLPILSRSRTTTTAEGMKIRKERRATEDSMVPKTRGNTKEKVKKKGVYTKVQ
jgi:hypothetical protein